MPDLLPPVTYERRDAANKIQRSIVKIDALLEGKVRPEVVERAVSSEGCGALLIELNHEYGELHRTFYKRQWELGCLNLEMTPAAKTRATAEFERLETAVKQLLCTCGLAVGRARVGKSKIEAELLDQAAKYLWDDVGTLHNSLGRSLALNRQEFHPSVASLLRKAQLGRLESDPNVRTGVVGFDRTGAEIVGRWQPDERRLLEIYREWESADREERAGDGGKFNGDVYYGAFRGGTHIDAGSTLACLFGPGQLTADDGKPIVDDNIAAQFGGTLMVAAWNADAFTSLPYRLNSGLPYVVVLFEDTKHQQPKGRIGSSHLNWSPSIHGVQRIENPAYSRGQVVVHMELPADYLS